MERSLLISLALHGAMLLLLWLGLPMFLPPPAPPTQLVPVEIADVSAITNTRVKPQPAPPKPMPQPAKPVEQPKPPTPKPPEQPPVPEQKVPVAEKEPEALPEKPPEKPPEPKKVEPPKKAEEKEKPKPDAMASILRNLEKLRPKTAPKKTEEPSEEEEDSEPESEAPSLSTKLSISEEDALKRQIYGCWNPPIGARNAEQLVVEVLVTVNPDRTVQTAKVTDRSRMASDSFFRAAAESALRALRHPQCTPLMLPPDKYEQWKVIRFNFDPRQML